MAVCGFAFAVFPFAARGESWAVAIALTLLSVLVVWIAYAMVFLVTWFISLIVVAVRGSEPASSPFAEHKPPPQLIAPEEPE